MRTHALSVETANFEFYGRLYAQKPPLLRLLHAALSFDQQSKSKRVLRLLKPRLDAVRREGRRPSVLDYGFGHGAVLLGLPRACDAYGCELTWEAVRGLQGVCNLLGRPMGLYVRDGFESAVEGMLFDGITCSHVLEHVRDDVSLLRSLASRLAPGGEMVINLPINEVWEDPKHIRRYDEDSIRRLLADCGLAALSLEQGDRWTAFFLSRETRDDLPFPARLALKAMRALFALLPLGMVDALEAACIRSLPCQQILIVAGKA